MKAYLIYVAGGKPGESYLLSDVSREDFLGVPCVKGTYRHPSSTTHWLAGQTMYVPVDKVLMVTEYESHDAYKDALKRHYEAQARQA
jgi:hypothetical protein